MTVSCSAHSLVGWVRKSKQDSVSSGIEHMSSWKPNFGDTGRGHVIISISKAKSQSKVVNFGIV